MLISTVEQFLDLIECVTLTLLLQQLESTFAPTLHICRG